MTLDEYNTKIQEVIKNTGNQAELSILLDELRQDYTVQLDTIQKHTTEIQTLKTDNDSLTKANGKLFLRLGEQVVIKTPGTVEETGKEKLSFDGLFNESGGLK